MNVTVYCKILPLENVSFFRYILFVTCTSPIRELCKLLCYYTMLIRLWPYLALRSLLRSDGRKIGVSKRIISLYLQNYYINNLYITSGNISIIVSAYSPAQWEIGLTRACAVATRRTQIPESCAAASGCIDRDCSERRSVCSLDRALACFHRLILFQDIRDT